MNFEQIYSTTIETLYGNPRDPQIDHHLLFDNVNPHELSIPDRFDLTHFEVYSIDPEGGEDADDAFSIYK